MLIKNKIVVIIICILVCISFNLKLYADEFNISATEITVDKNNDVIVGKGAVEAVDNDGKIIKADKISDYIFWYTKKLKSSHLHYDSKKGYINFIGKTKSEL